MKKTLGRLQQKALVAVGARKMDDAEFAVLTKNLDDLYKFYHDLKKHMENLEKSFFATAEPLMSVSAILHDFYSTSNLPALVEQSGQFKTAAQHVTKSHMDYCNTVKELIVECDSALAHIQELRKSCSHRNKLLLDNDKTKHALSSLVCRTLCAKKNAKFSICLRTFSL